MKLQKCKQRIESAVFCHLPRTCTRPYKLGHSKANLVLAKDCGRRCRCHDDCTKKHEKIYKHCVPAQAAKGTSRTSSTCSFLRRYCGQKTYLGHIDPTQVLRVRRSFLDLRRIDILARTREYDINISSTKIPTPTQNPTHTPQQRQSFITPPTSNADVCIRGYKSRLTQQGTRHTNLHKKQIGSSRLSHQKTRYNLCTE